MRYSLLLLLLASSMSGPLALADTAGGFRLAPLFKLWARVTALEDRVQQLETSAASAEVEGRSYCMMVNVAILRGVASTATEMEEAVMVRRFATFSGGVFTATVVSNQQIAQDDNGVVTLQPGTSPEVLNGTYTQSGRQLDVTFPEGSIASWYVSADGSVIYNNGVTFLGPFPNSLSIGLLRSATFIESGTCEDPAAT